ncbi:MAG: pyridoxamine 5'-phosphate oxidase [Balneolaceae bacterium]
MTNTDIASLRKNYTRDGLSDEVIGRDPVSLFRTWIDEAVKSEVTEPNAMTLCTVRPDGRPNSRTVLLKGVEEESIHFYTNYNSQKASELEQHPQASVTFWWPELERQIRLSGTVQKLPDEVSADYFKSRPRESQLGAWASDQSSDIASRALLQQKAEEVERRYEGREVPKPPHWGGFAIRIEEIEFWQGRPGRLHDRIAFWKEGGSWHSKRLQP